MDASTGTSRVQKSKQKNCDGCVQAKRRCDRRTPICSGCAKKKIACVYENAKVLGRTDTEALDGFPPSIGRHVLGNSASSPFALGRSSDEVYSGTVHADFQVGPAVAATASLQSYVMGSTADGDVLMDSFIDFMGDISTPAPDIWLVPIEQAPVHEERPSSPADEAVVKAYDKMAPFCVGFIQPPASCWAWHCTIVR